MRGDHAISEDTGKDARICQDDREAEDVAAEGDRVQGPAAIEGAAGRVGLGPHEGKVVEGVMVALDKPTRATAAAQPRLSGQRMSSSRRL